MRGFAASLIVLVACSQKLAPIDTGPVPTDDADADTDADADADADSDADTDTDPQLDCVTPYPTPNPGENTAFPECVTEQVFCGQTLFRTTEGGSSVYDYDYWLDHQALGSLINRPEKVDGPERVFALEGVGQGQVVEVTVTSCLETWASWILMGSVSDYCDSFTNAPKQHFYEQTGRFEQYAQVENATGVSGAAGSLQIIVDSSATAPTNFMVEIECF